MVIKDIEKMLQGTGLPVSYHHFDVGEAPDPPFVVYLFPESNNFFADNRVFQEVSVLHIELYTDKKDLESEKAVEKILDAAGLAWQKSEIWIESEKLYEVLYEMEVVIDG